MHFLYDAEPNRVSLPFGLIGNWPIQPVFQLKIDFFLNMYRLLNVYRQILGTSSYGEDARACKCISAI